jgi:hypothetical protein
LVEVAEGPFVMGEIPHPRDIGSQVGCERILEPGAVVLGVRRMQIREMETAPGVIRMPFLFPPG